MTTPTPFFIEKELETYERKIRIIQNQFAGNLKQEDAVILLEWIGKRIKNDN